MAQSTQSNHMIGWIGAGACALAVFGLTASPAMAAERIREGLAKCWG